MATTEGLTLAMAETKLGITGSVRLLVVGGGVNSGLIGDGVTTRVGVGLDPRCI
jgi:hypothetical protein